MTHSVTLHLSPLGHPRYPTHDSFRYSAFITPRASSVSQTLPIPLLCIYPPRTGIPGMTHSLTLHLSPLGHPRYPRHDHFVTLHLSPLGHPGYPRHNHFVTLHLSPLGHPRYPRHNHFVTLHLSPLGHPRYTIYDLF